MTFAGLPFAQLAVIFGVAAALVVGFYILKLRRRAVAVPFSPLWDKILRDKEATSLFSKLKRLLSLLLQLLMLLFLVFALGDPRFKASIVHERNLVVLVDASASMQSTDVGPSRIEVAKEKVQSMIRGLGGSDRMLIAQMDSRVTPLGPMSGDTSELERELGLIVPTETRADFGRALRYAVDSLRGVPGGEIVVVSDGALGSAKDAAADVPLGDARLVFVPVGGSSSNVGITQFSVRRYPLDKSRYEVMLELVNTGEVDADVELSLFGDGALVDLTKLRLKAGEHLPRFYPQLSGASRTLEAKIAAIGGSKDVLPADDRAFALLPERRRAKVLVVTPGNTYLEAALLLDEYLDVTLVAPADYPRHFNEKWDVTIFDRATPAEAPKANALYFDPRGPGSPVKVKDEITSPEGIGFDRLDKKHPLTRFTALESIYVTRGHALVPEPGDKVVGASDLGPLLLAGSRSGNKFIAVGFDVRESDLPLRVAWPLFLLNCVNWFTDEDAQYLSSFRTGDVWRIPVPAGALEAHLRSPDGRMVPVPIHEGRAVVAGTRAGMYELVVAGQSEPIRFAANLLDEEESAIVPVPALAVGGKQAGALEGFQVGVRREIWIYLLLAVLLLTAIEWATYHRRITV